VAPLAERKRAAGLHVLGAAKPDLEERERIFFLLQDFRPCKSEPRTKAAINIDKDRHSHSFERGGGFEQGGSQALR
jgi:hypothetical protein